MHAPNRCIGGKNVKESTKILKGGAHIISGTPGRVLSMITQKQLDSRRMKMLVLDEADEMFSKGFKEQVCIICWVWLGQ